MRKLLNIFKDKAALFKATLATKRNISFIHKAIIHATTLTTTSPPPDYRVATILNLGHDTRQVARACIEAIMDRLHNSGNPYVKLKCLIIIHNIIFKGSFILKDQLSIFPLRDLGSMNTPMLPIFRGAFFRSISTDVSEDVVDDTDIDSTINHIQLGWFQRTVKFLGFDDKKNTETWELWQWVDWYTNVLERNLKTSMVLGCYFSSSTYTQFDKFKDTDSMNQSLERDLFKEMDALICMIEEICAVPQFVDSSLVHEIVLLVNQEYCCLQHQIMMRLNEFSQRLERLSSTHSFELMSYLKRLKNCKKTLNKMFENRKRHDSFWGLIKHTKIEMEQLEERMEKVRKEKERKRAEAAIVLLMTPPPSSSPPLPLKESKEGSLAVSTHAVGRVIRASRSFRLLPCCGSHDVAVDRVNLTASQALS